MLRDETASAAFTAFVMEHEPRIRRALVAAYGPETGREAAAEALAYGWEQWPKIEKMNNPAGYMYKVGLDRARRMSKRNRTLFPAETASDRWVEPGLDRALEALSQRQRVVVGLLYGFQWSMAEVAGLLDVSKGTVQRHAERALRRLRHDLGVDE